LYPYDTATEKNANQFCCSSSAVEAATTNIERCMPLAEGRKKTYIQDNASSRREEKNIYTR
jgi:hypothetical protein